MPRRGGFTLVEVVAALALAGLAVTLAARLYGGALDGAARVQGAEESLNRWANGRRLLAQLVGSIEVGVDSTTAFRGGTNSASFTTWLPDARGWPARRAVMLAADSNVLVVRGVDGGAIALEGAVTSLDLDYLLSLGASAPWMRTFKSEVGAPLAIRLRIGHPTRTDTLVLVVGRRG